jgi:hypothetical protein
VADKAGVDEQKELACNYCSISYWRAEAAHYLAAYEDADVRVRESGPHQRGFYKTEPGMFRDRTFGIFFLFNHLEDFELRERYKPVSCNFVFVL